MINVKVQKLFLSNMGFVVLLKGDGDERSLPIVIGATEAQAIALRINQVDIPRPLTHDLFKNVLDILQCRLERVEVVRLEKGTFYANLVIEHAGRRIRMDSRPSDAIALALRSGAGVFVDPSVMEEAGRVFSDEDLAGTETHHPRQHPKPPSRVEKLKHRLDSAVEEERFEDAARLRDEIQTLEGTGQDN